MTDIDFELLITVLVFILFILAIVAGIGNFILAAARILGLF